MQIKNFIFNKHTFSGDKFKQLNFSKGEDWPVVYILENVKKVYIGQTNNFRRRMNEHLDNPERTHLDSAYCIIDNEFNKSAVLDVESKLISYFDADKKYELLNVNAGSISQDYYNRTNYLNKIPAIWKKLQSLGLANKDIFDIENSDLFKYSPYKSLTIDQFAISQMIIEDIRDEAYSTTFIEGNAGTGKTVLAMYLLKKLRHDYPNLKIALVVSMQSLRKTLKEVAGTIKGLRKNDVINPNQVASQKWDVLIVDEAHRLKQRKNLTNYKAFDDINKNLEILNGNQLDWIIAQSNHQILFYDEDQSVKPTDISREYFTNLKMMLYKERKWKQFNLETQHRVKGGYEYIKYSKEVLQNNKPQRIDFNNYDVKLYKDFQSFNIELYSKEKEFGLCRMVSGYSFDWISKNDPSKYDIEIQGIKKQWNSDDEDWINSKNALDEVGCIHTVQGYDLNYIFLIFGKEIDYIPKQDRIVINKDMYFDKKGKAGIYDQEELKEYILNIYATLMSRGIQGIYMYACNENFYEYLRKYFNVVNNNE
ncbi:MAG: DNA/RNA helicase domain-containing protein [Acholeplasmataceae bacterium]